MKREVLLDGDNFCNGAISRLLREALEQGEERIRENGGGSGDVGLTIKVVMHIDVDAGTVRAAVGDHKIAVPKAKSEGQIIRIGAGGPTIDLEEDGVGNRSLPGFKVHKGGE